MEKKTSFHKLQEEDNKREKRRTEEKENNYCYSPHNITNLFGEEVSEISFSSETKVDEGSDSEGNTLFQDINNLIRNKRWNKDNYGNYVKIPSPILIRHLLSSGNTNTINVLKQYALTPQLFEYDLKTKTFLFEISVAQLSTWDCNYPKKIESFSEDEKSIIDVICKTMGYSKRDAVEYMQLLLKSEKGIEELKKLIKLTHQQVEE